MFALSPAGTAMFCVAGLQDTSRNTWKHCRSRRLLMPSHSWSAGLQVRKPQTLSPKCFFFFFSMFTRIFFLFSGNPVITPRRVLRSQWFSDPWTCGSYSYLRKGCSEQDLDNMMEPLPPRGSKSQVTSSLQQNNSVQASDFWQTFDFLSNSFSRCRFCLLERRLIHVSSLPSMELFWQEEEKLIDSSPTTPPLVHWKFPSPSFEEMTF